MQLFCWSCMNTSKIENLNFFTFFGKKTGSMVWYKVNANIFYYFCLFKPKFLLIPFRISHFYGWKQQKTNQNLQYDNRSTLTTGKVSADFSWFFISNGGVLGSCYTIHLKNKKSIKVNLLGIWTCFRYNKSLLILPLNSVLL